jgi:hypothetical protein
VNRTFLEYYRCPQEFARCFQNSGQARQTGHFRLGPEAVCYGAITEGKVHHNAGGELHDALGDTVLEPGVVRLSFDPDEVVDNLRLERYCNGSGGRSVFSGKLANKLYYCLRPFLGVSVRRHLQKLRLADWRSIPFPHWPVDRTVEQVHETMLRLCVQAHGAKEVPFIWFWPKGYKSCVIVTHDVEAVKGRDFCPTLMDIDESFGIKSSFQLVPEQRYSLSPSFIEDIRSRDFEVNVHDLNHDGRLFSNEAKFLERVRRINEYGRAFRALGFRSGALYRNVAWYEALEFSYDMSVPNSAHLDPQRGGCCTVMPYFIGKTLELPVTMIQDYSLFYILGQHSIELWKQQIAQIMEQQGLASFIVHPDYIQEPRTRDIYKSLLAYLADLRSEGKIWIALPRDVDQWWRARSQMELVRRGNEWVIEGPEKDKARVAYAVLEGDHLAYQPV